GCDTGPTQIHVGPSVTVPIVDLSVQPSVIAFSSTGTPCLLVPVDGIALAVQSATNVSLTQVTFQLIDGTHPGNPVTIPSLRLSPMFRSTVIAAGTVGVFPFTPTFACVIPTPTVVVVNVTLVDEHGNSRQVSTTASVSR